MLWRAAAVDYMSEGSWTLRNYQNYHLSLCMLLRLSIYSLSPILSYPTLPYPSLPYTPLLSLHKFVFERVLRKDFFLNTIDKNPESDEDMSEAMLDTAWQSALEE